MKKIISVFLALFLAVNLSVLALPAFAEDAGKIVYLSGEGSDENNGSESAPVATLLAAYKLLGTDGGTVIVSGNASVEGEYRALCDYANGTMGKVTITSVNNAVLTVTGTGIWFPGETAIENIRLHFTYTGYNSYLVANCRKLTVGEGVEVTVGEGVPGYPIIYGSGFYSMLLISDGTSSDVTVKSGTWAAVYGGGGATDKTWNPPLNDDVPGNVRVTIEGGTIDAVYGGGNGGVGGNDTATVHGNVELFIKGGTVKRVVANGATSNTLVKGNITVTVTGGTISEITVTSLGDMNFVDGSIQLVCDDSYRSLATNFPKQEEDNPNPPEENTTGSSEIPTAAPGTSAVQTPESDSTNKPVDTNKTQASQGGCSSAVAGSLAVIASLSLAVLVYKKKR